jgi:hypothetical protein
MGLNDGLGCRFDRSATSKDDVDDTGGHCRRRGVEGDGDGQRATVAEAADRLGVTPDALRKRIKRGSIEWEANRWS